MVKLHWMRKLEMRAMRCVQSDFDGGGCRTRCRQAHQEPFAVQSCTDYFKVLHSLAPLYISTLLTPYSAPRLLRSDNQILLTVRTVQPEHSTWPRCCAFFFLSFFLWCGVSPWLDHFSEKENQLHRQRSAGDRYLFIIIFFLHLGKPENLQMWLQWAPSLLWLLAASAPMWNPSGHLTVNAVRSVVLRRISLFNRPHASSFAASLTAQSNETAPWQAVDLDFSWASDMKGRNQRETRIVYAEVKQRKQQLDRQ